MLKLRTTTQEGVGHTSGTAQIEGRILIQNLGTKSDIGRRGGGGTGHGIPLDRAPARSSTPDSPASILTCTRIIYVPFACLGTRYDTWQRVLHLKTWNDEIVTLTQSSSKNQAYENVRWEVIKALNICCYFKDKQDMEAQIQRDAMQKLKRR